jgi:hypothetical protein
MLLATVVVELAILGVHAAMTTAMHAAGEGICSTLLAAPRSRRRAVPIAVHGGYSSSRMHGQGHRRPNPVPARQIPLELAFAATQPKRLLAL